MRHATSIHARIGLVLRTFTRAAGAAVIVTFASPSPSWADGGVAGGPPCGDRTITQSTAPDVIAPGTSVACASGGVTAQNSLARAFTVDDPKGLTIGCVTFGIEFNDGSAWPVHVRLLSALSISGPYVQVAVCPADSLRKYDAASARSSA